MGALPVAAYAAKGDSIPIGLELFCVRDELKKDQAKAIEAVARMGYECVEFFAPYYDWTPDQAKEVRKQLNDLKIRCYSTHNAQKALSPEGIGKAIELNKILGSRYVILANPDQVSDLDGWKRLAELVNTANETFERDGLHAGYHNHTVEWKPIDGQKPMDVLADETGKSVVLQLDVGTCVATGNDPVAWINAHPGRIRSMHLKDWSPGQGYKTMFGEGVAQWKQIFAAAESKGGIEYYLMEQEESTFPELEAVDRALVAYRNLRS